MQIPHTQSSSAGIETLSMTFRETNKHTKKNHSDVSACKICIYLYDNIFVITLDFFFSSFFFCFCHNISPKYCLLVVQSLNLFSERKEKKKERTHWDHYFSLCFRNVLYRSMVVFHLFIPHVVFGFIYKKNKFPLNNLESVVFLFVKHSLSF